MTPHAERDRKKSAEPSSPPAVPVPFSPVRTWLIAQNTLRQAGRQQLLVASVLVAGAFVFGAQWLRDLNFGSSELTFIADFGFGAMAWFGGVLTIVTAVQLFFSEIEHRTVLTLLAKPVWRAEFVIGKIFAIAVLAAAFCALMTATLAAVLWMRETAMAGGAADVPGGDRATALSALVGTGVAQWLKLVVLGALTLLVTSFAQSQLFAVCTGFLIWMICELQYVAQEAAAHSGSVLSRAAAGLIAGIFPNFRWFEFSIDSASAVAWGGLLRVGLYSAGYVAAVGALATFSFRRREI